MAFYDLSHAICGASRAFYDFPTPFVATPCLLLPFRAFNSHPVPVYGCLFTAHSTPVYSLSTPFMVFYDLFHAICGPSASFAAHQHLLRSSRARLQPVHTLYGPSRACLQPIRAFLRLSCVCLQPIRAFYGFPTPVCGHSAPFTALPRPQRAASYPSRHRLHPPDIPRGERRALPAPAQGSRPLRIPFGEPAPVFPVSPSPKRRRRTAPTRGPSAVYALCR